jgi:hypothetical protein
MERQALMRKSTSRINDPTLAGRSDHGSRRMIGWVLAEPVDQAIVRRLQQPMR